MQPFLILLSLVEISSPLHSLFSVLLSVLVCLTLIVEDAAWLLEGSIEPT